MNTEALAALKRIIQNRISWYINLQILTLKLNFWAPNLILYQWGEFWMVHTEFLLGKETLKNISLKKFLELFYLWLYPVDIQFSFSWKCWTELNRITNKSESCFGSVYHCRLLCQLQMDLIFLKNHISKYLCISR